jgi:GST-like protein
MIDLHYWTTPNGHKITMYLEETGLPYRVVPVNLQKDEQFKEDFLRIAPNNKMPAIADHDPIGGGAPISVFESGAILLYLVEKTGQLMPKDTRARMDAMQWLFWQVAGLGPMAGQLIFFLRSSEKIPFAVERYTKETARLFGVLNKSPLSAIPPRPVIPRRFSRRSTARTCLTRQFRMKRTLSSSAMASRILSRSSCSNGYRE